MKTSITAAIVILSSLFATVASAQHLQFGIGQGRVSFQIGRTNPLPCGGHLGGHAGHFGGHPGHAAGYPGGSVRGGFGTPNHHLGQVGCGITPGGGITPVTPRPSVTNPLIGTWQTSDRAVRIDAGNRFTVVWMDNGAPQQASGTYTIQGRTIIFMSDAGEVWPWNVHGFSHDRLTMSHSAAGQRVFQRVNG